MLIIEINSLDENNKNYSKSCVIKFYQIVPEASL